MRHLPPVLAELCGDRVMESIPATYLHRVIASALASRMVYREGLDWLESMPAEAIARLAERYLEQEAEIRQLVAQVRTSGLENSETIATLLETGGVAAALRGAP